MSVISPVADDLAVVYLPLLPVGLWALLRRARDPPGRGPRRGVPDARLQRPGRPAGRRHRGRGEPADRGRAGGGRLRGPHLPGDRDRDQRLGWADLHDPADPAWLTGPAPVVDRDRLVADLRALVRIPSITGSEEAVAAWAADALRDLGLRGRGRLARRSPTIRADPDWPGEEMPRTSLPVVIGRAGRAGGRRLILSGHLDVVPPGDPATWTVDPWGGEIRDGALYGRGRLRHEGRRRVDPGRGPGARRGGRPRPARRRADRRLRAVRGGRRAGDAGGDPGRRQRRPRDHHRAVEPRRRRRPRRRDHVPADRARVARPMPRSGARASRRSTSCSC